VTRTRLRTAVRAAGAAALVVVLAACANNAGSAVVVGSSSVSDASIASMVDEVYGVFQDNAKNVQLQGASFDRGAATSSNVDRVTRQLLLEEAARREGITVTQGQVDQIISQTVEAQFSGDATGLEIALASQQNIPPSEISGFARAFLITDALGQKLVPGTDTGAQQQAVVDYLVKLGDEIGVEVAPRFGTWVPEQAQLGPVSDDLSQLPGVDAPEAAPAG
jgi:hypothetical protein